MKKRFKTKLRVNKISIEMNPFVEEFLTRTTLGMVTPLRGVDDIQSLEIHQEKGNVRVIVNDTELSISPFPNKLISTTLAGLVSSLKEVDNIDSLDIDIKTR